MIYTKILLIGDKYAILLNNMLLLVVTSQQRYDGCTYADYWVSDSLATGEY